MNNFDDYPKAVRRELEQMTLIDRVPIKRNGYLIRRIKICTKLLLNKVSPK